MARYASFVDQTPMTAMKTVITNSVSRPPPPSPHATHAPMAPPQPLAVPSPSHQRAPQGIASLARPTPLGASSPTPSLARPAPLASPHTVPVSSTVVLPNKGQVAPGHNHIDRGVASRSLCTPSPLARVSPLMNPTIEIALQCVVALVLARILNMWLCARS
nr:hypothetical protein [Pandoravirus aubagnensis]